nr:photosynthetic complex assembly protein PuhC [Sphingomicrobium sediminis]
MPRPPLYMIGALMVLTVILAGLGGLGIMPREAVPEVARAEAGTSATASRTLFFRDEADGGILIVDAASDETITRYAPGTGGFIRSTMRSLVHHRRLQGIGAVTPFTLTRWNDGGLTLADPETGRSVELVSFGRDNEATFGELLGETT